jgi:beta-lactamase regulating signal transducer with metallopeptidase domain
MHWFLQTTISNTLLAAILALVALGISKTFRRPALAHALWLLVLLKLITPPLWNIPLKLIPADSPQPPTNRTAPLLPAAEYLDIETLPAAVAAPIDDWRSVPLVEQTPQPQPAPAPTAPHPLNWPLIITLIWLSGSALCAIIVIWRLCRFAKLLAFSTPAPAHIQNQARHLASRLDLSRCPQVHFIPGPLYPMLWSFPRSAKLLIPTQLWHRLESNQQSTLLLHELAHYRRGDHFIRALELVITIFYWWNPIAWWARHELREAEEQCCDAWVISTLPRCARDYAIALLEAIDFVSTARPAVPVLASPMGEFHDMKRRLLMIRQHDERKHALRALSWTNFVAICALAALLLPLSASLAQQVQPAPAGLPPTTPYVIDHNLFIAQTQPDQVAQPAQPPQNPTAIAPLPPANALPEVAEGGEGDIARSIEQELQQTRVEIARLTQRLQAARTRLNQLQAHANGRGNNWPVEPQPRPQPGMGRLDLRLPAEGAANLPALTPRDPNTPDQERRLRTVEEKLDLLIDELREMRRERVNRAPAGVAR